MELLLYVSAVVIALILIFGIIFSLPSTKGWVGERVVRIILRSLSCDRYIVINDVKFYGEEEENKGRGRYKGKRWSCQIDHLVISVYGIFCIETKNYLGKIFGNYRDRYLQRKVLGMSYRIYSPIYQNYRHLERLVETFPLIKCNSKHLHSIVCFMPGCSVHIDGSGAAITCHVSELKKNILNYQTEVMPMSECLVIADRMNQFPKKRKHNIHQPRELYFII